MGGHGGGTSAGPFFRMPSDPIKRGREVFLDRLGVEYHLNLRDFGVPLGLIYNLFETPMAIIRAKRFTDGYMLEQQLQIGIRLSSSSKEQE